MQRLLVHAGPRDDGAMKTRTLVALAAFTVMVFGLLVPSSAAAAGGGCGAPSNQYPVPGGRPWNVTACSSDNGVSVFADAYVNATGSTSGSCQLRISVIDRTTGYLINYRNDSCYAGHHPAVSAPKVAGHRYWAQARINTNQTNVYWTSWPETY
jgi:hypothetical protein